MVNNISLYEIEALVLAAHRSFALLAVGPDAAGVDVAEAAHFVQAGLLTQSEAEHGYLIPGLGIDPWQFAVLMGAIMAEETSAPISLGKAWKDAVDLRGASLKRWIDRVQYRIRARRKGQFARLNAPEHLTPAETAAWLSAKTRAGYYIAGLSTESRSKVRKLVQDAIANKLQWPELADLLEVSFTGDARNWQRVARTELQGAFNEGVVATAIEQYGSQAAIAFIPESDACDKCKAAFLDESGKPKIFPVQQLVMNGSNVGRKPSEWLPTIWPMHPNCRCQPINVPPGKSVDSSWELVSKSQSFILDKLSTKMCKTDIACACGKC